jgi:hypothetical protein
MQTLMHRWMPLFLLLTIISSRGEAAPQSAPRENASRLDGRRFLSGPYNLPDEKFLKFAERVRPEFIVMGNFGPPRWAQEKSPRAWLAKWKVVFDRMHASGIKVVGMMELLNVGNSPQEMEQFVDFVDNKWDIPLLGPKSRVAAKSLIEKRSMPLEKQTGAHAPRGCANNPNFRAVEKALVKALINAGIDGFITHRNMFGECGCPYCHADWNKADAARKRSHEHKQQAAFEIACNHCSGGFRRWLSDRYDADALRKRFGIRDTKTHRFAAILSHYRKHNVLPSAIELEAMKFARHSIKEVWDDVFAKFGRSVKQDLILAQWNHMPYFDELHLDGGHIPVWNMTTFAHASANERWSLPMDLWGRGEDFYWYCNWGTCQNTQLEKRFLADITLYAKLLRSQARGKPFVINKYDFYRPRNMMAEAAGLGMIVGAIRVPYDTDEDSEIAARWFAFLKKHADLYAASNGTPVSDVLMVYPRTVTHAGNADGLEMLEVAGRSMIVDHTQFDFTSDDLLESVDLSKYKAVIAAETIGLDRKQFATYLKSGGKLIVVPRKETTDAAWKKLGATYVTGLKPHTGGSWLAVQFIAALNMAAPKRRAMFDCPYTVEPHVYQQKGRYVVHFVNYLHREKAPGKSYFEKEAPIAAEPINFQLQLMKGEKATRVRFLDPDAEGETAPKFQSKNGRITVTTPKFLTYGVCIIEVE